MLWFFSSKWTCYWMTGKEMMMGGNREKFASDLVTPFA